jgi:hypothetical protein
MIWIFARCTFVPDNQQKLIASSQEDLNNITQHNTQSLIDFMGTNDVACAEEGGCQIQHWQIWLLLLTPTLDKWN